MLKTSYILLQLTEDIFLDMCHGGIPLLFSNDAFCANLNTTQKNLAFFSDEHLFPLLTWKQITTGEYDPYQTVVLELEFLKESKKPEMLSCLELRNQLSNQQSNIGSDLETDFTIKACFPYNQYNTKIYYELWSSESGDAFYQKLRAFPETLKELRFIIGEDSYFSELLDYIEQFEKRIPTFVTKETLLCEIKSFFETYFEKWLHIGKAHLCDPSSDYRDSLLFLADFLNNIPLIINHQLGKGEEQASEFIIKLPSKENFSKLCDLMTSGVSKINWAFLSIEDNLKELPQSSGWTYTEEDKFLVIGDKHGNFLKMIHFLVQHNFITVTTKQYQCIVETLDKAYERILTKNDITNYTNALKTIDRVRHEHYPIIGDLGDNLAERVGNDLLYLLFVILVLIRLQLPFRIILSNHDYEFINLIETYFSILAPENNAVIENEESNALETFLEQKTNFAADYGFDDSLISLKDLLCRKVVTLEEVANLYEQYRTYLDVTIIISDDDNETTFILTHAPVAVYLMYELNLNLNRRKENLVIIKEESEALNKNIQELLQKHQLTKSSIPHCLSKAMWFRLSEQTFDLRKSDPLPDKIVYLHGHDGDSQVTEITPNKFAIGLNNSAGMDPKNLEKVRNCFAYIGKNTHIFQTQLIQAIEKICPNKTPTYSATSVRMFPPEETKSNENRQVISQNSK